MTVISREIVGKFRKKDSSLSVYNYPNLSCSCLPSGTESVKYECVDGIFIISMYAKHKRYYISAEHKHIRNEISCDFLFSACSYGTKCGLYESDCEIRSKHSKVQSYRCGSTDVFISCGQELSRDNSWLPSNDAAQSS